MHTVCQFVHEHDHTLCLYLEVTCVRLRVTVRAFLSSMKKFISVLFKMICMHSGK